MFLLTDDPDAPQSLHYRNDVTAHVVFKEVIQCSIRDHNLANDLEKIET